MTHAQRAVLFGLMTSILECKQTITPAIALRAENLRDRLSADALRAFVVTA